MAIFWNTVGSAAQSSFTDTEFFSFTTEGQPISRAAISKSIMKKVMPEAQFRKYVSKVTDFGANQSSYFILPKKVTRDTSVTWTGALNEFDPLPSASMTYKQFDVSVDERGVQFPFTERAKIFSNYDVEAEITEQAGNTIVASIEKDLVTNAFPYLDIVGVANNGTTATISGKSLAPTKSFSNNTTAISVTQVTYGTGTIDANTIGTLTMQDVLNFATVLRNNYCPSYSGSGFGNYLIIMNQQARNKLMVDPVFYNAVTRFQDKEKLYAGYIGSFYGQEFVLDNGMWIETFINSLNAQLAGKAICIFLGKEGVKEAIVKPEQVLPLEKSDHGRFATYAVNTYRGETPMWFSTEGQAAGGVLVGA
jgi:hypothetical protein